MKPWRSKQWGVAFSSPLTPMHLIGSGWNSEHDYTPHAGEPGRALLFTTRAAARHWCRVCNAKWQARNDLLSDWRVRPVRVVETVRAV